MGPLIHFQNPDPTIWRCPMPIWGMVMTLFGLALLFFEWRFLIVPVAVLLIAQVIAFIDPEIMQRLPLLLDVRQTLQGDD